MNTPVLARLRARVDDRLFELRGPESGTIVLGQKRVFILPSRHGAVFVCALFLMLTGSINYDLSLGFVLTFLLAAVGINAILYTFRNLARMRIAAGRVQPVFAGNKAEFGLVFDNPGAVPRYSIGIARDRQSVVYTDLPPRQSTTVKVTVPALRRGLLRPGRVKVFTVYPLGLCYAWAYVDLDVKCLVYPRPETARAPLPLPAPSPGSGMAHGGGQEDFAGLRSFRPGDPPRHVAWKAVARGQELLTKQFSGRSDAELWLDWNALPPALGVEARLSRLTRWVLDAHSAGLSFGLRVPGTTLAPAPGEAQRDRCLEALALYPGGDE
jgi:uncharacterized protein (DUF58 family)